MKRCEWYTVYDCNGIDCPHYKPNLKCDTWSDDDLIKPKVKRRRQKPGSKTGVKNRIQVSEPCSLVK